MYVFAAFNSNPFDDIRTGRVFVSPPQFFVAFVSVASADNSSTKLDTFIPRVITHSLKRRPAGFYDLSNSRAHRPEQPGQFIMPSCSRESALNYGPAGHTAVPDSSIHLFLFHASVTPPIRQRQIFQRIQILSPSISFAFFVPYKRKSIRERIIASRSNATDYYVETTALDIHQ